MHGLIAMKVCIPFNLNVTHSNVNITPVSLSITKVTLNNAVFSLLMVSSE